MPTINFDGADKVILGSEADRAYLGNELVWEETSNFISSSTLYSVPSYSRYIDIKAISNAIDVSNVQKIEIGSRWTLNKTDISQIGRDVIVLSKGVSDITGGQEIPGNTPIKIYYE